MTRENVRHRTFQELTRRKPPLDFFKMIKEAQLTRIDRETSKALPNEAEHHDWMTACLVPERFEPLHDLYAARRILAAGKKDIVFCDGNGLAVLGSILSAYFERPLKSGTLQMVTDALHKFMAGCEEYEATRRSKQSADSKREMWKYLQVPQKEAEADRLTA